MHLGSRISWRTAAQFAILASASLARADWYTWVGTDPYAYGDSNSWLNQTTQVTGFPGVDDNIAINRFNGVSNVVLDQDRKHSWGQFEGIDFDLNGHTLDLYVLEAAGSTVHDGIVKAFVLNAGDRGWGSSALTNVQGHFSGVNVVDGATLDLVNSSIDSVGFSSGGVGLYNSTLNLTASSINMDYVGLGSSTIDADSSIVAGLNATPDIYNATLVTSTGIVNLNGSISAVGSAMGRGTDSSVARTNSVMLMGATGQWTDSSGSVNSLGFGGDFTLDVNGGKVQFDGDVNIGEGNIDNATLTGLDGSGFVIVENGGTFRAKSVNLGGWSRYALIGETTQIASGSGNIQVRSGGTLTVDSILAVDQSRLNRGSSSLDVQQGGTANVGFLLGGALNLDSTTGQDFFLSVQGGGSYTGDDVQLIGAAGKNVSATFLGADTVVDVNRLLAFNGARISVNGVENLTVSDLRVGENYGTTSQANIRIENSTIKFGNRNNDVYNDAWAINGNIDFIDTTLTVADGQSVSLQAGAGGNSGYGFLNLTRVQFNGLGGMFAGAYDDQGAYGALAIADSNLKFNYTDQNGDLFASTVGIGDSGPGSATIQGSTIDAFRFRAGVFAGGSASVTLYDSSLIAHSTTPSTTHPAAITIGNEGKATLEMFNSSLNAPSVYIGNDGVLKGDGTVNGDPLNNLGVEVENHGRISPGHSPGALKVNGNLLLTGTSVLEMEIDLSDPASYDQILTSGTVTLGGTFHLKALGSGTFDPSRSYTFLTAGNFLGAFSSYEIDPAFGISASAFSFNGGTFGINPQPVPEPASLVALSLGGLALLRRRRK